MTRLRRPAQTLVSVLAALALTPVAVAPVAAQASEGSTTQKATGSGSSPSTTVEPEERAAARADVPPGAITFSEFSVGTTITTQYASAGVVFDSAVFISTDDAQPTAPVISGSPQYEGPVSGHFTKPGTTTRTTVAGFSMDVGYINQRNSTEVSYFDSAGKKLGAVRAQSLAINRIEVNQKGIASFVVKILSEEDAGFSVDNLTVIRSATGIKPKRMASFGDSYSSGEGLIGDGGLDYDCATALSRRHYWKDTTAPGYNGAWRSAYCDTRTMSNKRPGDLLKRDVVEYENRCHRHKRAYPNAIRQRLDIGGRDSIFVACSGAVTADIRTRAQYGTPGSPVNIHGGQTQLSTVQGFAARGGAPDFVTVGIGGNDAHFGPIIEKCMKDGCLEDTAWVDGIINDINGKMHDSVRATYEQLRSTFPAATIAAFGYPSVIGDPAKDCGGFKALWMRIEESERRWLKNTVFPALNQSLREAAQEAGVTFIDISSVTKGHEVCAKKEWVNGLKLWSRDTGSPVASESFHPNELAHDAIASWFMSNFVSRGRLVFTNPTPSEVIAPPAGTPISLGTVTTGVYAGGEEVFCVQACPLTIQGSGYQPGATVNLTLGARPGARAGARGSLGERATASLGTAVVGADGTFSVVRPLPSSVGQGGTYSVTVGGAAPDSSPQYGTSFVQVYRKKPGRVGVLDVEVKKVGKPKLGQRTVRAKCLTTQPKVRCRGKVIVRSGGKVLAKASQSHKTNRKGQVVLKLKLSKQEAARVAQALRRGAKVSVQIKVVAKGVHQKAKDSDRYRLRR